MYATRVGWISSFVIVVALFGSVASADQCINDDLVVTGSIGVGFDSVCNQAFGFDTIILKENNLRIFFDDTSTTASFPKNDWRLTANDSANGGGEFFSIDDATAGRQVFRVDAGAPSNSLRVNSSGRVGIKTASPVVELHIADGDTPTVRLEQNGTSGFALQTWDMAGNEANFFIRDVTNGSKLPFRITPNSPQDSLRIFTDKIQLGLAAQNIGIGTSSPTAKLHLTDSDVADTVRVLIDDPGTGGESRPGFILRSGNAASSGDWRFETDGGGNFQIDFVPSSGPEILITDATTANGSSIQLNGTVTKFGGSFKIDHPVDPANKYLYHSFVESPDMMNIYNGNITLDENGEALVEMPEWFQALNREFRYQLTAVGAAAPDLHVAGKIVQNRFKIAGGKSGMEVSWMVTGVRKDPWAEGHRIKVEEDKPAHERGYYLHPEGYNQPVSKSVFHARETVADSQ